MTGPRVDVLVPGLQTTVQDLGRWGHQASGVPVAGPMDPFAHRLANALVGNRRNAATLEVTLVGPELRFGDERLLAVAGADLSVTLDGEPVAHESAIRTRSGSILRFGGRRRGTRAYVAVEGGIDVPPVLGSRATHLATGMGGWQGRALLRGDCLPLGPVAPGSRRPAPGLAPRAQASPVADAGVDQPAIVRVLPGPQRDRFSDDAIDRFVSAAYTVTPDSSRMGYRLDGPVLVHCAAADIISDATPLGSVQVPASGQPVLLMADRQTTGGYAKLATVISADIGVVAQVGPGETILFRVASRATAIAALIARERPLLACEAAG